MDVGALLKKAVDQDQVSKRAQLKRTFRVFDKLES